MRWLGPGAGPADLSLASLAAYQRELAERGLSSQTVRKDRAALNTWLRCLAEHELVDPRQARPALSVQLPRAEVEERERPHALSDEQYRRLVAQAERPWPATRSSAGATSPSSGSSARPAYAARSSSGSSAGLPPGSPRRSAPRA